ncbi:MAG: tetratricopeptide repeat protein [Anaerolineales bacterium]|nr:tetratricopeptide repeat protein [Anaerolineales bacterium]
MNHKRTRPNWFRIILLCLLVLGGAYVNRYILPNQPQLGVPSPTPTRASEAFITEAEELFKAGKLVPAIAAYEQAILSKPDNPAAYIALARVQVWAGRYPEAQESAESAILLNADNSMAHAVKAWALDFQGETLRAEDSIKRALELDPNNAIAHAYYAEILIDANNNGTGAIGGIEKAIEESNIAIGLAPDLIESRRARGYVLENTGNYQEAIPEYKAALAINNNIADLHLALGRNYSRLSIYDQAIAAYTDANALNPEDHMPDYLTSRTYATIGEFSKAMQFAETAVGNTPTNTNLRGNLGVMYYRNAYFEEAVEELEYVVNGGFTEDGDPVEAINLAPNNSLVAEYYFTYGLALSRLNKCSEALEIAQSILASIPTDELAVENANEIVNRCQQNLEQTPTPPTSPEPDAVSTESLDEIATSTPTVTATP